MGGGDQPFPWSLLVHAHPPGPWGPECSAPEPEGHMVPVPVLGLPRFLSLDCQKDPRTQASCSRHLLPHRVSRTAVRFLGDWELFRGHTM